VGLGLVALPYTASAFDFDMGEVKGSFDTTLSAGALWRMEKPDKGQLAISNGGTSRSANDDDANVNYDKGDLVSGLVKATNDLEIKYGNVGVFNRVSAFYDFQAHDDREYFGDRGDDRLISEVDFLDAFVYANFKIDGHNASVRVGKQVVNWGESTFIQNSINVINPFDVARLRAPGSELKEALLPTPMFWGSVSLTQSLSLETVWLWSFQETQIDPRGSFFSTNDFLSDDGRAAYTGGGRRNDQNGTIQPPTITTAAVAIQRTSDDRPQNETQQYGVALRYFADWLNSTEFGLYYLKYHSRVPYFSGLRATDTTSLATRVGSSRYFAEYPENIELYGISFNTDGPFGIALQGEYSYRPNLPVQLAGVEGLLAALRLPNVIDSEVGPTFFATAPQRADGYRRVHAHQAQATGTKAFGPTLGASQFALIVEAGVTHLELDEDLLYAGPGTTTVPSCRNAGAPVNVIVAAGNGSCQDADGFVDQTSWGYRVVTRMDYENVIGPMQVSPRLVFSHDVNGVGPAFNEDAKALTFGLGFNYLQRWQGDIGYTAFFGGRRYSGTDPFPPGTILPGPTPLAGNADQSADFSTSANPLRDRDFLAVSVSYAF
jgi:hypothetical protein